MEKSKDVCILDADNYYIDSVRIFKNPKNKFSFSMPENTHDIPLPDYNMIKRNIKAKWDSENKVWNYVENENTQSLVNQANPMYYFTMARKRRLEEIDDYIVEQSLKGTYKIPTKLEKYKNDVYSLPEKIKNNEVSAPEIKKENNTYAETKNPEDMIVFDWPTYAFRR